jgi:hypothetical protein
MRILEFNHLGRARTTITSEARPTLRPTIPGDIAMEKCLVTVALLGATAAASAQSHQVGTGATILLDAKAN